MLGYNTNQADIESLTRFLQGQNVTQGVLTAINTALTTARGNLAWLSANYQPVADYLASGVWRNSSVAPAPPAPAGPTPWLDRRLPDTARPLLYTVVHYIDLDSAPTAFWGTVNITLAVTRPTNAPRPPRGQ